MRITRRQLRQLIIEHMIGRDDPKVAAAVADPADEDRWNRGKEHTHLAKNAWERTPRHLRGGDPEDPESMTVKYKVRTKDRQKLEWRPVKLLDMGADVLARYTSTLPRIAEPYEWRRGKRK